MSHETRKGYVAEAAVVAALAELGNVYRPRTTSHQATDTGDVAGLPMVFSVKNHLRMDLAAWVDEMIAMVGRSPHATGVVVHKRRGKGKAGDWYVTTSLDLLLPLLRAYISK